MTQIASQAQSQLIDYLRQHFSQINTQKDTSQSSGSPGGGEILDLQEVSAHFKDNPPTQAGVDPDALAQFKQYLHHLALADRTDGATQDTSLWNAFGVSLNDLDWIQHAQNQSQDFQAFAEDRVSPEVIARFGEMNPSYMPGSDDAEAIRNFQGATLDDVMETHGFDSSQEPSTQAGRELRPEYDYYSGLHFNLYAPRSSPAPAETAPEAPSGYAPAGGKKLGGPT